jgi:acetoacetyl-CoA synthetase
LLNFAENLLFPPSLCSDASFDPSTAVAVITATEDTSSPPEETTWSSLRDQVRKCSNALRAAGVKPHDIVAGFVSNHARSLVAMLGAAAVGAIWTGISPDNGVSAVLDRLEQIGPSVLFVDDGMAYNGKPWDSCEKVEGIVDGLKEHGLRLVVLIKMLAGSRLTLEHITSRDIAAETFDKFLERLVLYT